MKYPLVNVYITMDNHHAINGKTYYFDWAMFNGYASLPEGMDGMGGVSKNGVYTVYISIYIYICI